jgi:hypothetical protein
MRLAIQISGEFRMLHMCIPLLQKNVVETFKGWEIDVFLHTWRREEDSLGTFEFEGRGFWHKTMPVYGHGTGLAIFKPRAYFLEKYEDREDLKSLPRAYSMYYSIKRANDARHEYERLMDVRYDLVMRYRTDCLLNEDLFQLIHPYSIEKKSFLCIPIAKQPKICDGPVDSDEHGLCDWFAIGTPDAMDVYCGTYDTFLPIKEPLVPESMLAMQLKSKGITKQTILKRPIYDMYLVEGNGKIRNG